MDKIEPNETVSQILYEKSEVIDDGPKFDLKLIKFDQMSLLLAFLLNIQEDRMIKNTQKEPIEVLRADKATKEQLIDRIKNFNVGVDPNLWEDYRNEEKWKKIDNMEMPRESGPPFLFSGYVIPSLGEVLSQEKRLLGHIKEGKIFISLHKDDGYVYPRGVIILTAEGEKKKDETYTVDHKNSELPLNDSIQNIRWASREEQYANRREHVPRKMKCQEKTGKIMPVILGLPTLYLTDTGLYRSSIFGSDNHWRAIGEGRSTNRPSMRIGVGVKTFMIHRLIMESVLGRELLKSEKVDHIDENYMNNSLNNLDIMSDQGNTLKTTGRVIIAVKDNIPTICFSADRTTEVINMSKTRVEKLLHDVTYIAQNGFRLFYAGDLIIKKFIEERDKFKSKPDQVIADLIDFYEGTYYYELMKLRHEQMIEVRDAKIRFYNSPEREFKITDHPQKGVLKGPKKDKGDKKATKKATKKVGKKVDKNEDKKEDTTSQVKTYADYLILLEKFANIKIEVIDK